MELPAYGAHGVIHPDPSVGPDGQVVLAYTPYHSSLIEPTGAGIDHENPCLAIGLPGDNWRSDGFSNPVIQSNPEIDWKSAFVADPSILYVPSQRKWFLWSQPKSRQSQQVFIALANSEDGVHWGELPDPVIRPGTGWSKSCRAPAVVFDETSSTFTMWYDGVNLGTGRYHIGRATSANGKDWTHDESPLVLPGIERYHAWHPGVIHASGRYWMTVVYGWMEFDSPSYLALFVSSDGYAWEPYGPLPLLAPDLWSWKGRRLYRSSLLAHGGKVWLFASAYDLSGVPHIGLYQVDGLPIQPQEAVFGGRIIEGQHGR